MGPPPRRSQRKLGVRHQCHVYAGNPSLAPRQCLTEPAAHLRRVPSVVHSTSPPGTREETSVRTSQHMHTCSGHIGTRRRSLFRSLGEEGTLIRWSLASFFSASKSTLLLNPFFPQLPSQIQLPRGASTTWLRVISNARVCPGACHTRGAPHLPLPIPSRVLWMFTVHPLLHPSATPFLVFPSPHRRYRCVPHWSLDMKGQEHVYIIAREFRAPPSGCASPEIIRIFGATTPENCVPSHARNGRVL